MALTEEEAQTRAASRIARRLAGETLLLTAVVAGAIIVRLAALSPAALHVDEALFASFGLSVARHGNLLLLHFGFPLDRPPLFFWILGGAIALLGDSPITIRLPNLLFSAITVVMTYLLAKDLGGGKVGGIVGAIAIALSPFAILFGPTVFEEPGAVALGMTSLVLSARRRPSLAGVTLALAVAIKLFAAVYLPLALALALVSLGGGRHNAVKLGAAFGLGVAALLGFMALRTVVFGEPWFISLQYGHVGGTRLLPPSEWGARASQWLFWIGFFIVGSGAIAFVAVGIVATVTRSFVARDLSALLLILFSAGYLVLLSVMQSPIFDRYTWYLLPTLMAASGVGWGWAVGTVRNERVRRPLPVLVALVGLVALWPGATAAIRGEFPVAGVQQRTFDGYRRACDWLIAQAAEPQVVWSHSLDWHFGYCLADSPVSRYWYPDGTAIVGTGSAAYLAQTELDDPTVPTLLRAGHWSVDLAYEFIASDGLPNIWLYRITPP
jgi:4-amino-4-deoxy-L-arabinose transferase-like glycosyltransferase